jgi:hypothetical protein
MFRHYLSMRWCVTIGCLALTAGCDAVRPTHQVVRLQVNRLESGQPVAGAVVTAAPERERDAKMSREEYLGRFVSQNLNTATTGASGEAQLRINTTIIRGGIFDRRDPLADRVTGEEYLLKVETERDSEVIAGTFRSGETVSGKTSSVTIKSIGAPTADEQ